MPKSTKRKPGQMGRMPKYPWDKWFSYKREFVLTQGVDFDCKVNSMSIFFRNMAKQRKVTAHITLNGESLHITLEKPNA